MTTIAATDRRITGLHARLGEAIEHLDFDHARQITAELDALLDERLDLMGGRAVSARTAFAAGWVAVALLALGTTALILGAIWLGDDRLGDTAALFGPLAILGGFAMCIWTSDPPPPNLPRAERKRLRAEEQRLRTDARICEIERELGRGDDQ